MIRLYIIDDSHFMRVLIKKILKDVNDIEIIGEAENGNEALEKINSLNPDCITVDLQLPGMNGAELIEHIMYTNPKPTILLTGKTKNKKLVLQALEHGAYAVVYKPQGHISVDLNSIKNELVEKIRMSKKVKVNKINHIHLSKGSDAKPFNIEDQSKMVAEQCIAIGVSTGGPRTLKSIISLINPDIKAGIVVAQHILANYTPVLIEQIANTTKLNVVLAQDNMYVRKGHVYICPGDKNIKVEYNKIHIIIPEDDNKWTPSVDMLFESVSKVYHKYCTGIILTGLGDDGSEGIKHIKNRDGYVIAQDEKTSVVYGMPKAAANTGLVDEVLPANKIANFINQKFT